MPIRTAPSGVRSHADGTPCGSEKITVGVSSSVIDRRQLSRGNRMLHLARYIQELGIPHAHALYESHVHYAFLSLAIFTDLEVSQKSRRGSKTRVRASTVQHDRLRVSPRAACSLFSCGCPSVWLAPLVLSRALSVLTARSCCSHQQPRTCDRAPTPPSRRTQPARERLSTR